MRTISTAASAASTNFFLELIHNPCFIAPAVGWLSAQLIKTIIYMIIHKEFNPERIFGAGGMPSSHSATVCALVTTVGMRYGAGGAELPIAFFMAFIVMYDAMGVRRETGEQGRVLNELISQWREKGNNLQSMDPMDQFKEFVGHTPLQVVIGAILGICVGIIVSEVMR